MQPAQLKRSKKGLQINLILISITAIVFALITSWMVSVVFRWAENGGVLVILIVWAIFVLGWGLGAIKLLLDWRKEYYEITNDALIFHGKTGFFGSVRVVYRYESIASIRMTQGYFGKRFEYGDVYISTSSVEDEVVLKDIEQPLEQLAEVQRLVGERAASAHSLAE